MIHAREHGRLAGDSARGRALWKEVCGGDEARGRCSLHAAIQPTFTPCTPHNAGEETVEQVEKQSLVFQGQTKKAIEEERHGCSL